MKKSKLSIGLVTSFIATMALSACGSSVTKDKTNLVDFKGYGDQDLSISIDDIYKEYMESSSGIAKCYDQVMEVLIRHAFQKDKAGNSYLSGIKKNYNQIVSDAKDDVKGAKETAKSNADTNGTNYKTEWQAILSEKGVKDEEELLQYFIYQKEQEEIKDWYFEKNKEDLRREYLGVTSNASSQGAANKSEKASSRYPYHVRHILIKNEDGASDYTGSSISADAAKLLSSTVDLLARGNSTFGDVALKKSEDGSASSYGDVGLMTNAISEDGNLGMVSEFQLGLYAYDAIIKNAAKNDASATNGIAAGLGLTTDIDGDPDTDDTVSDYFTKRSIVEIPYSVFVELGDVAELENNYISGASVSSGKSALYPRNLLWNRYLNNHSIFVITNGKRESFYDIEHDTGKDELRDLTQPSYAADQRYFGEAADTSYTAKYDGTAVEINYANLTGVAEKTTGFRKNVNFRNDGQAIDSTKERVLCDENNNVIIGVRSKFGIHLMIVEKSIYDYDSAVKLEDYYTTYLPSDKEHYPTVPAGEHTYVDFIYSDKQSEYKTRADAVKSAIKSFDTTYEYRLYEELKENEGIDQANENNKALFEAIKQYIELKREKNQKGQEEGIEKVWKAYIDLLETQDNYRDVSLHRIVPEGCKIAFSTDTSGFDSDKKAEWKAKFEEGGACYVK